MKGMRAISRGAGFRGALDYAFERTKGKDIGRLIGGNMSGVDPQLLAKEFGAVRALRPTIERPVWHNSLRLPLGDKIDDESWRQIADNYMQKMGFSDLHPRVYVMHDDTKGQHIHIVASRIALDGSLYLGQNENLKSTQHIAALEKEYNLRITKNAEYVNGKVVMPAKKALKKGELEKALSTGIRPPRLVLQELVSAAMKNRPTTSEFLARLDVAGVLVVPNIAANKMDGFSFAYGGVPFRGSKLGDAYKWGAIKKRIDYDEDRDNPELARRRAAARSSAENDNDASSNEPAAGANGAPGNSDRADNRGVDADSAASSVDRSSLEKDRGDAADRQRQEFSTTGEQEQRARDSNHARNDIEAIAYLVESTARPAVARDLAEKISAWREQHAALDAPLYQISMHSPAGKIRLLDACDAASVEKKLIELRRYEQRGRDIRIRAIDPKRHFIQIHGVTAGQLEALHSAGYEPSLVLQPGQGAHQAIIAIERMRTDEESDVRDVARAISAQLNVQASLDDRMPVAGFKQRSEQKNRMITRIITAARVLCRRTQKMLQDLLHKHETSVAIAAAEEKQAKRRAIILDSNMHPGAGQVRQYLELARYHLMKSPQSPIEKIDVTVAREMLNTGLTRDEVEHPIATASPGAVAYGVIAKDYACEVLDKALSGGSGGAGSAEPAALRKNKYSPR